MNDKMTNNSCSIGVVNATLWLIVQVSVNLLGHAKARSFDELLGLIIHPLTIKIQHSNG